MTGDQLLQLLQSKTPEERKLDVFTFAQDVGPERETVYNPCDGIRVSNRIQLREGCDYSIIKGLLID